MNLPKDPILLYSIVNTKLRDCYSSLDDLCGDMCQCKEEIISILRSAGFEYNEELNKFV